MKNLQQKYKYPPTSDNSRQLRGSGFLVVFLVVAAMLTGMAINIAKLQQSALASTGSNITALQAYQYAESKADIVRAKKYDELSAQVKKDLAESNYQDEVLLSEENSTDEYKERTATVNVYLKDEARPRASLKVLRTSVEQSAGVPIGSILPWPSNVLP